MGDRRISASVIGAHCFMGANHGENVCLANSNLFRRFLNDGKLWLRQQPIEEFDRAKRDGDRRSKDYASPIRIAKSECRDRSLSEKCSFLCSYLGRA